ncbi:MAG: S1C family serine protease [Gammaproteobacteria bacterium]|jgi:S1-C subfamily serine protease
MRTNIENPLAEAMVSIKTLVPDDAMSAGLLGTERTGHGARIREDGLIVTIGYVVHEAESVWIGSSAGDMVPGFVVGYDFDSGFGLVKPSMPLTGPVAPLGSVQPLKVGNRVTVAGAGPDYEAIEAFVVAKQEFAGRWEYLLEEAIFTAPAFDNWSGAALIDRQGRLCGLGSLVIQGFETNDSTETVNMFVPIDLLPPIIDDMCQYGRRRAPPRPWLGMLVHEDQDEQLTIVGIYRDCPADRAGLKPGDVILSVNDQPVSGLANMFRRVWRMGEAGVDVPLAVLRDEEQIDKVVKSDDRASFQRIGTLQ